MGMFILYIITWGVTKREGVRKMSSPSRFPLNHILRHPAQMIGQNIKLRPLPPPVQFSMGVTVETSKAQMLYRDSQRGVAHRAKHMKSGAFSSWLFSPILCPKR